MTQHEKSVYFFCFCFAVHLVANREYKIPVLVATCIAKSISKNSRFEILVQDMVVHDRNLFQRKNHF